MPLSHSSSGLAAKQLAIFSDTLCSRFFVRGPKGEPCAVYS